MLGKKVIREKRSKLQGKEAALQAINQSGHREVHEDVIGRGAPTIGSLGTTFKWGAVS